jgi:hypothetical protein
MNVYPLTRIALGALFFFTGVLGTAHGEIVSDSQKKTAMTALTTQAKEDATKVKPALKNDLKNELVKDAEGHTQQLEMAKRL